MSEEQIIKFPPLNQQVLYRDFEIDGLGHWVWPIHDPCNNDQWFIGGWNKQKNDWETSHSTKWFTHVKSFDICVQAGGCCGMYPRLLAEKFGVVYTFEPDPLNFYCLVNNCLRGNVVAMNAALADQHKMVGIYRNGSVGEERITDKGWVPCLTIDDLMLEKCDLIALDCEGQEGPALLGAAATISTFRPVVICEDHKNTGELLDILKFINGGYECVDRSEQDNIYVTK